MKNSKLSVFSVLLMLMVAFIAGISSVSAAGQPTSVDIVSVEINDIDNVDEGETVQTQYLRGETLDLNVKLFATADVSEVEVQAEITGDEHHDIQAESEQFDVVASTYYYKSLSINLPDDMEQDKYLLTVSVIGRGYAAVERSFYIKVDTDMRYITIKDVDFSQNPVKAGRGLEATVRVKNVGEKDEEYVKVGFEIPELGIKAADVYMNDFDAEESRSSEPLYIRIPECASEGTYKGIITVEYDDSYKEATQTYDIQIIEGDTCVLADLQKKTTTIMIGADNQVVAKGKGPVAYPITITNNGITTKSYQITASGTENWADVQVAPSNVIVVEPGKSQPVYVYVDAKDEAKAGEQVFTVNIKPGTSAAESIALKATVAGKAGSWDKVKKALEIGLVVLLVLLIILGVIVAFNRMKGEKSEGEIEDHVDLDKPVEDYSAGSYY